MNKANLTSRILLTLLNKHGQDLTVSTESVELLYLATQGDPFDPAHHIFGVVWQAVDPDEPMYSIAFHGYQN
ncbi:hypothetical protein ES703_115595 [subsurface metagenome]